MKRLSATKAAAQAAHQFDTVIITAALANEHTPNVVGPIGAADVAAREAKRLDERAFELMHEEEEN